MKRQRKSSAKNGGPAKPLPLPPPAKPALNPRRRWAFRLAAMTLVPLLLLLTLEAGLRISGYGYNPAFFLPQPIGGEEFLIQNEDFSRRFFPAEVIRQPSALRMAAHKPEGTPRIFVLGESAAMGDPEPAFGPARYLEALLRQRYPTHSFEIVNVAFTAINSHVILPIARECAQQDGDVWIVYVGNNEMVGPFGAATVFGAQSPPRFYVRCSLALQRTRVGQLGRALAARLQKSGPDAPSWGGMQMFLESKVAPDSPKRTAAVRNFAGNLNDIVAQGLNSGAHVILNTVAVNLRDSPPFASLPNERLNPDARTQFDAAFAEGRRAQTAGDWARAAVAYAQALKLDPQHAEAHYRLAVCLGQSGQTQPAQEHFQLACDLDALPFRADTRINDAIRKIAAKQANPSLQLLDAPAAIARQSGVIPCGEETFYEHVHFDFTGSFRLGRAWAEAVEQALPAGSLGTPAADWATQEACERALALTDWNHKLVLESMIRRLQQPPLSSQINSATRLQRLREREQKLLAAMNPSAVARAREIYQEAIAAQPEDHFLHEVYGNFLQLTGDLPGATREWQRTAELMPHDFLPWFQVGVLRARQNQHEDAQANLRTALRLRPGLIEGWLELGRSLAATRQWEAGLDAFQRGLKMRPQDPMLWASAAAMQAELGRRSGAMAAYQRAIELQPAYWEARAALGDLYSQAGQIPEAIAQYELVLRTKPDFAAARLQLGLLLARRGNLEAARQYFQQVLQLEPNNAMAAEQLRRIQSKLQRPQLR
jgi:tetratricopeptide (TPR) repeat protein